MKRAKKSSVQITIAQSTIWCAQSQKTAEIITREQVPNIEEMEEKCQLCVNILQYLSINKGYAFFNICNFKAFLAHRNQYPYDKFLKKKFHIPEIKSVGIYAILIDFLEDLGNLKRKCLFLSLKTLGCFFNNSVSYTLWREENQYILQQLNVLCDFLYDFGYRVNVPMELIDQIENKDYSKLSILEQSTYGHHPAFSFEKEKLKN